MSETFTITGTARQINQDEFVTFAGGKVVAPPGTVVIESEGGAVVAFATRDGFIATFGRDPLEPYIEPKKTRPPAAEFKEQLKAPAKAKK